MANIVISRIQHRRGRRENLPQPLLPGEVAVTSDTSQAWMGQDPELAVPSINVYTNKLEATAQGIIDNSIVEVRFGEGFTTSNLTTMINNLVADGTVTLTENDILWDSTRRGQIIDVTITNGGTNYTNGSVVTAVSSTGSGFTGVANCAVSPGPVTSITITNGGINYQTGNTTLTVAGGNSDAVLTLDATDLWDSTVHIGADPQIDANNTVTNVKTAVTNTDASVTALLSSTDIAGGWAYGDDTGGVDRLFSNNTLPVNNHTEAANVVALINRINSSSPGEITGLTYTNLNIEITGGTNAGATAIPIEVAFYIEGISLAANDFKGLYVFTQDATFESGVASEAYARVKDLSNEEVYDLQKNGVSFGSVTFPINSNVGTVTIGASTTFAKGDRLEIYGPATPGGSLDEIAITITGTVTV